MGQTQRDGAVHLGNPTPRKQTTRSVCRIVSAICLILFFVLRLSQLLRAQYDSLHNSHKDDIQRGDIRWEKCDKYGPSFECGTLVAPLDYTSSEDPRNASIAIIRYKAGDGKTPRSEVLGSLLLNPGGPGGSGLQFLSRNATDLLNRTLSQSLDEILDAKYDLVSFDPRGVGSTWPQVQCFGDPYADLIYETIVAVNGNPGDHSSRAYKHEIGTLIAESHLLGDVCFSHPDAELFRFMSTPFVVRDMQLLHRALGDSKLNYWGFSYGTVLGSTYADMFPEDVGRLVIDGVVDVPNYYEGKWNDNFRDIEAELDAFFTECFNSGAEACKLSSLASSGEELRKLVLDYGDSLKLRPLPVATAEPPQILTYSTFILKFFMAMYAPKSWPSLADKVYEAIANGDAAKLLDPIDLHPSPEGESEAFYAIACGDAHTNAAGANSSTAWDFSDYDQHMKPILKDTKHFAPQFGKFGVVCNSAWQARAAESHYGNFTSTTSFPILALGNDYDPVTPGTFADKMANLFPGAVSVRREGYGHCSMSQPSQCIERVIKSYFVDGEMPEPGLKCGVDIPVFGGDPDKSRGAIIADALHGKQ